MMKYFKLTTVIVLLFGANQIVRAQYPTIPADVQKAADLMMNGAKRHSDEAWNKAYPIVQDEARKGRPYIPWAARPVDLPQAEIPAFPGAMGGGEYSFGGRGGKVIVVTSLADDGPGTLREAAKLVVPVLWCLIFPGLSG